MSFSPPAFQSKTAPPGFRNASVNAWSRWLSSARRQKIESGGGAACKKIPSLRPMPAMEPVDAAGARPVNSPFGLGSRCLIVVLGPVHRGLTFWRVAIAVSRRLANTWFFSAVPSQAPARRKIWTEVELPPQLYASGCATCHKSPQSVAKTNSIFGLESFLSEHYTTSRGNSAALLAAYLKGLEKPSMESRRGRAAARSARTNLSRAGAERVQHGPTAETSKDIPNH